MKHELLKNRGFTLIELMVTITITSALVAVAAPNMTEMFAKHQIKNAADRLYADINWARSTAISSNQKIAMSFRTSGSNWCYGFKYNSTSACDCTTSACEKVISQDNFNGVSISSMSIVNSKLVFNTTPMLSDNTTGGSLSFSKATKSITMNISLLGRPSLCSSTVSGVPAC